MVQLVVRFTAAPSRSHQLVQALKSHSRRAARSAGCGAAHLSSDLDQPDVFWYWEDWNDPAALEGKVRSEQFSELLALMETSAAEPLLEFRVVEQSKGLDYVAAVRAARPGRPPAGKPS
jgi:quinol monooxygenase YgiN